MKQKFLTWIEICKQPKLHFCIATVTHEFTKAFIRYQKVTVLEDELGENILTKQDTLIIIMDEEPNESNINKINYLYEHDRSVGARYLKISMPFLFWKNIALIGVHYPVDTVSSGKLR